MAEEKSTDNKRGQYKCHGAHKREEQEHADEDMNSNDNINKDIKAGHDKAGLTGRIHRE